MTIETLKSRIENANNKIEKKNEFKKVLVKK